MKTFKIALLLLLTIALSVSCSKETLGDIEDIPGLGGINDGDPTVNAWIQDNYTNDYNIYVRYTWADYEVDYDRTLVPVETKYVIPMMSMVKRLWIDPYEACSPNFIKLNSPKKIVIIGSDKYDDLGGTILGEAEGGRKIVLYRGNKFGEMTEELVRLYMNTIQHEFAHILHQTKSYSTEFNKLSAGKYNPTGWKDTSAEEAQQQGFVSQYASSAVDEDFAEVVAIILTYGRDAFDDYVDDAGDEGGAILRAKESIVVNYFKNTWKVDFYDTDTGEDGLESLVQRAIKEFLIENDLW